MTNRLSNVNCRKAKITIEVNVLIYSCVKTTKKVIFLYELAAEETESMYDVLI